MSEKNAIDTSCLERSAAREMRATNRIPHLDEHLYQGWAEVTDLNPRYYPPVHSMDADQLRVELDMWRELGCGEER